MKVCTKCKIEKDFSDFNHRSIAKDKLSSICKSCNRENLKSHYHKNKSYYFKKNKDQRKKVKDFVISKKTKCYICGEDHPACLDFHHKNPSEKLYNVASMYIKSRTLRTAQREIDKCIVLCSNCHRKLHYDERMAL